MSADTPPPAKWPWSVLGLDKMPPEAADVRRAYARALKKIDQSKDIEGFAALRSAYEQALALREGRSASADAKRARKAAAVAKAEPTPQTAPEPSPEAMAKAARIKAIADEHAFAALLQSVTTANLLQSFEQRVTAALSSPFMAEPARKARLGATIARHLKDTSQTLTSDEQALPSEFTQSLLSRLDSEFGWLSDFAAFRRDFWFNDALLDLMLDRKSGGKRPADPTLAPRRTGLGKLWGWITAHPGITALGLVGLFQVLSVTAGSFPENQALNAALVAFIVIIGAAFAFLPVWWIYGIGLRFFHRYTAGLMTGILLVGFALLFVYPGGGKSQLLALALIGAVWLTSFALKHKRGAQFESLLRRFVKHLKT